MKNKIILLLIVSFITSCATREEIVYFQGAEDLQNKKNLLSFEPVIEVNDILKIDVTSLNKEVVEPFNKTIIGQQGGQQNPALSGYLVDIDGNIQFPVLGQINVKNKPRSELEAMLTKQIKAYVTDAVVSVRILNFRVVVLGEAGAETVINVENERISVPELLANVGGISYNGKRQNILVIREVDGVRSIGRIDMTKADVFNNPFFYLKQNDIVYVEPTYRTVKAAGFITSYTGLISLFTTAISLFILFSR